MTAVWLFTLVFGLLGLALYRAFRFTALSVGTRSPEFHRVTRRFPAWRYFTRFTPIVTSVLAVQWIVLPILIFSRENQPPLAVAFFILALAITLVGTASFLFFLDWKYWQITKGVTLTLDPHLPQIIAERANEIFVITPQNVTRMIWHKGDPFRSGRYVRDYGYLIFCLNDGRRILLNDSYFKWHDFLNQYFREVPREFHYHRVPWVKPLPVSS